LKGENDSAGVYCSYVNFKNGSIECFANGSNVGIAYAVFNPLFRACLKIQPDLTIEIGLHI